MPTTLYRDMKSVTVPRPGTVSVVSELEGVHGGAQPNETAAGTYDSASHAMQLSGLLGAALVWPASRPQGRPATSRLIAGWLLVYFSSQTIAHWTIGHRGSIRFKAYGRPGTGNPVRYLPVMRWLMQHLG